MLTQQSFLSGGGSSRTFFRVCGFASIFLARSLRSRVRLKLGTGSSPLPKLSKQVRSTHSQDGAVVLDIRHGQMFRLNPVASRMLELMKQDFSDAQIADEISLQCGVSRAMVESDLRELIEHLAKHRLLESEHPESRRAR